MHAQTNLQLYRQLIDAGWSEPDLLRARAAHDLSSELFAGCYRPSNKTFIAHLVGTASALAAWGEPPDTVLAGLLHSSYLYGDFGDGTWGVGPEKRRLLRDRVGEDAERLVNEYTSTDHLVLQDCWQELRETGSVSRRTSAIIRLADLCDECRDAGPLYTPEKPLAFGLPSDEGGREAVLVLAEAMAGGAAVSDFQACFEVFDRLQPPAVLHSRASGFRALKRRASGYRRGRVVGLFVRVLQRLKR
jgi:hypothetical protein